MFHPLSILPVKWRPQIGAGTEQDPFALGAMSRRATSGHPAGIRQNARGA